MDEPKPRSSTSKASRLWRYRYLLVAFWIVLLIIFLGRPLERLPSLHRTTAVDLSGKFSDTVGKLQEEQGKEDEAEASIGGGNGTVVEMEAGAETAPEPDLSATAAPGSTPTASEEAAGSTAEGDEKGEEQTVEAQSTSGSIATSTIAELATSSPAT
ncbi:MAG: hypothetical protein Q9167_001769 [Letrouitia subvulpina]